MSRSFKKPVVKISPKIDKDIVHGQVRAAVRAELNKQEPNELIIESDVRDLGLEDMGTKLDYIYIDPDDNRQKKAQEDAIRK